MFFLNQTLYHASTLYVAFRETGSSEPCAACQYQIHYSVRSNPWYGYIMFICCRSEWLPADISVICDHMPPQHCSGGDSNTRVIVLSDSHMLPVLCSRSG